jgi:hypothetical protein
VSIRFQADNDLKRIIVDATLRREPSVDFQTAQAAGLDSLDDELVLGRASEQGRILVSHDKRTMPLRLADIWVDNRPEEWVNRLTKIPF